MIVVFAFLFFSECRYGSFLFMNVTMSNFLLMKQFCVVLGTANWYLVHSFSLLSTFQINLKLVIFIAMKLTNIQGDSKS
jgi:hypothetical protein